MPSLPTALTRASLALTLTGQPADTNTLTLGGKVYTLQTTLTDVDGNVEIGSDAEGTIDNLAAAINLAAGAGTAYAASMTSNQHCYAKKTATDALTVYARVPGVVGNYIPVAETMVNATFAGGGTVLANGAGHVYTAIAEVIQYGQPNSDIEVTLRNRLGRVEGG